jgi:hypothetical protein
LVTVTALVVLGVTAATAYAALNQYTSTATFTTKAAGTAKKPVAIGFTQHFTAGGLNGNRTAVITDVKTKVYGLKSDGKDFPTCSSATIVAATTDSGCPKKAMVATGSITAILGSKTDFSAASGGGTCDPLLHVWNAGQGKIVFFFVDVPPAHGCLGTALKTGSVGPYPGTVKTQGKYLVIDSPVPSYVGFPAPGLAGSLTSEVLKYVKSTIKVHGKTVAAISSVGCLKGKRPYSVTFTAQLPTTGTKESNTLSGLLPCSR